MTGFVTGEETAPPVVASSETRAQREARWREEIERSRAAWEARTPEPTTEEIQRRARATIKAEPAARGRTPETSRYRPRCSDEDHAKITETLPRGYILDVAPKMTQAQMRVLAVLRHIAGRGRSAEVARSELALRARVADRHVRRCIVKLEEWGFLHARPEQRISRDQSETRIYDLADQCWPRVGDRPAMRDRQARRRRSDSGDKIVTPSGCPTDTIQSRTRPCDIRPGGDGNSGRPAEPADLGSFPDGSLTLAGAARQTGQRKDRADQGGGALCVDHRPGRMVAAE